MDKVNEFDSVLRKVDILVSTVLALFFIAGIAIGLSQGFLYGLSVVSSVFGLWVIKVLCFGLSFTLIQIAENTSK